METKSKEAKPMNGKGLPPGLKAQSQNPKSSQRDVIDGEWVEYKPEMRKEWIAQKTNKGSYPTVKIAQSWASSMTEDDIKKAIEWLKAKYNGQVEAFPLPHSQPRWRHAILMTNTSHPEAPLELGFLISQKIGGTMKNPVYTKEPVPMRWIVPEEKVATIQMLQKHQVRNLHSSDVALWQFISSKVLGITRTDCHSWLSRTSTYQMNKQVDKREYVCPVVAEYPHCHVEIDCIYLEPQHVSVSGKSVEIIANELLDRQMNNEVKYALMMVDIVSKKCWAWPLKTLTAKEAWDSMESTLEVESKRFLELKARGFVKADKFIIQSDNGSNFKSKETTKLFNDFITKHKVQIQWKYSLPYHPWANGQIERLGKTIKSKMRYAIYSGAEKNWTKLLKEVTESINSSIHSSTLFPPSVIHEVGWNGSTLIEAKLPEMIDWTNKAMDNLDHSKDRYVQKVDRSKFKVGDYVRIPVEYKGKSLSSLSQRGKYTQIGQLMSDAIWTIVKWYHNAKTKRRIYLVRLVGKFTDTGGFEWAQQMKDRYETTGPVNKPKLSLNRWIFGERLSPVERQPVIDWTATLEKPKVQVQPDKPQPTPPPPPPSQSSERATTTRSGRQVRKPGWMDDFVPGQEHPRIEEARELNRNRQRRSAK